MVKIIPFPAHRARTPARPKTVRMGPVVEVDRCAASVRRQPGDTQEHRCKRTARFLVDGRVLCGPHARAAVEGSPKSEVPMWLWAVQFRYRESW